MDKYLISLEFDKIAKALSSCAGTNGGRELCLNIALYNNKSDIEYQLSLTRAAKQILDEQGQNCAPIDFAVDPSLILTTSRLSIENIIDLTSTLCTSRKLKNFISKTPEFSEFYSKLISNKEMEDSVHEVFDENFNIKDNATDTLKSLKMALKSANETKKQTISNLLSDSEFTSYLQDNIYTERFNRTVFQIKASDKSKVKGIVHDVSATNKTFFIEPEALIQINNKIRQIECDIEAEIERILLHLSKLFLEIKEELIESYKQIIELDMIFAKAKYAIKLKAVEPVIVEGKILKFHSMFHPLLYEKADLVKNDFEIGYDYKTLLITGSNTGGKTVTLKTAGILTLMAKAGMFTCADYAEIYPFKNVYSDIEENQDITQSLSTFSAHIKNISNIVEKITEDDLVLFDELGAGTDPTEGAALAGAILEYLNKKGVITIATTHLGELKILPYENSEFKNASVEFDNETLKPSYKLIIGLGGSSYAIDIAKNLNLKSDIIDLASNYLLKNSNPHTQIFNKIEQTHKDLISHTKAIEKTKISEIQKEEELNEKLKEIKEKKKKTLDSFKKKYQSQLDNVRDEIKNILLELRAQKSEKLARRAYSRLSQIENKIREEFTKDEDELNDKYPPINFDEIKIGQSVLISKLNQVAILASMPDSKGFVEIKIGLIKSKIHKSKLSKTDKKLSKQLRKTDVSFDDFTNSLSFAPRLDLRGMRADEAIDEVEHHLDLAIRRNILQFTIIHGHGTGALKHAIRNYLKDNPCVLKFRAGEDTEGGDGVTIVDVK